MKKILTFLVMLLCSVSILMAQDGPKFPYQAVVRDMTAKNLYSNQQVKINVVILQNNDTVFQENHDATTNLNGMVSILVGGGTNVSGDLTNIMWDNNVSIAATFKDTANQTISYVETPVTPVPYALQADNAAFTITTTQIVNYLKNANTNSEDVDSVLQAIVENPNGLKQYCKDTVYHYFMNHKAEMRDLALYFINLVDTNDIKDANNAVSQDVKNKAIALVKQYIKDNKDAAKEILMYYLSVTTKDDIVDLWNAVKGNSAFDTVGTVIADTAIKYIKAHPEQVQEVVEYYIDNATVSQVNYLHNLLKSNTAVYGRLVEIFDNHLLNYLNEHHYLTGICQKTDQTYDTISFCELAARVETLKNSVLDNCAITVTVDNTTTATSGYPTVTIDGQVDLSNELTITITNGAEPITVPANALISSNNGKTVTVNIQLAMSGQVLVSGATIKVLHKSNTYGCTRTVTKALN